MRLSELPRRTAAVIVSIDDNSPNDPVARRLRELGCDEIDIADTIGVGTPTRVQEVMRAAAAEFSIDRLSGHFHDTYGQACLLYTSPSPRDLSTSRMPSSA